ncbi:MAG: FxLYD domain-containing protein [Armatimonadetes bacterium]|nr:FxLYD domain-containing protein [Armatimonadota bacterium]
MMSKLNDIEYLTQYDESGPALRLESAPTLTEDDKYTGYVINISDKHIVHAQIEFLTYDKDGARLDTPSSVLIHLAPGERWKFRFSEFDNAASIKFCRFVYRFRAQE